MKWTDPSSFLGGVLLGALLFAGCAHGSEQPARSVTQEEPSEGLPAGIDQTPPTGKAPDTPDSSFEGNPGKAQEGTSEQTPAPAGSTPAAGAP